MLEEIEKLIESMGGVYAAKIPFNKDVFKLYLTSGGCIIIHQYANGRFDYYLQSDKMNLELIEKEITNYINQYQK